MLTKVYSNWFKNDEDVQGVIFTSKGARSPPKIFNFVATRECKQQINNFIFKLIITLYHLYSKADTIIWKVYSVSQLLNHLGKNSSKMIVEVTS